MIETIFYNADGDTVEAGLTQPTHDRFCFEVDGSTTGKRRKVLFGSCRSRASVMRTLPSIVISCSLFLSGCSLIPTYDRPSAPIAGKYPDSIVIEDGERAERSWENFFFDSRLKALIALSLSNNRDLRVAALNVEKSRAQYRISRSSLAPTVEVNGGYSQVHSEGYTSQQWSASVASTAYEVDFFGRVRSLNVAALESYLATGEAKRSAQILLIAEVATQYFALRQAEEQLALSQQTLGTVEESYALNKATYDAGATSEVDLRTAEGQVQTAKINILIYQNQLALTRHALELLIGTTIPVVLPAPADFDGVNLLAPIPVGLPSELLLHRPDILQAEHLLKAAHADVGAARAALFPSIALSGSLGSSSKDLSKLFSAGTGTWDFAPQIVVPIFSGGRLRSELEVSKIDVRIEIANYEKSIQVAFREVSDALYSAGNYNNQLKARTALISSQQKRFELADLRYRQGDDTYLNVLSAQQDLYSARQGRITAQYNKLSSEISLYEALGGGWK